MSEIRAVGAANSWRAGCVRQLLVIADIRIRNKGNVWAFGREAAIGLA
jgi:hypothetical protein